MAARRGRDTANARAASRHCAALAHIQVANPHPPPLCACLHSTLSVGVQSAVALQNSCHGLRSFRLLAHRPAALVHARCRLCPDACRQA